MSIPLYIKDGIAYAWNAEDWFLLRSKYRICGALIGSAPTFPRQNDFLGLPMALMSEEAAFLVDSGICELYQLPKLIDKPTDQQKNEVHKQEQIILEEQKQALKKQKIEQLSQKIDIIVAGKRQKLLSKGMTDVHLDKQTLLQEEINKLTDLAPAHVLLHLPTKCYMDTERVKVDTSVLIPSVLEGDGAIKYFVFKDLWNKGYHITNGSKFGSDYLVYPGDPVKFHAMYMVRCIYDPAELFRPSTFVAYGRLSVSVNKLAVLAFCTNYGNIEYQTLQWHDSVNG